MPDPETSRSPRLPGWLIVLAAVVVAVVAAAALLGQGGTGSPAPESTHALESIFEDEQLLLYQPSTPAGDTEVLHTLETLKAIGVDRLRLLVVWRYIAPAHRPAHFDAGDPAAYGPAVWAPYDRIVRLAAEEGLGVYFDVTAPGPAWAMTATTSAHYADHYAPSATDFAQFVEALGRRYSGDYTPSASAGAGASAPASPLPRVSFWSFWNEPNQPGWLAPQYRVGSGSPTPAAPALYRGLLNAGFSALGRTGHGPGHDTILFGELAPEGCMVGVPCPYPRSEWSIPPIPFLQTLFCLSSALRPLSGAAATAVSCPARPDLASFVRNNPGLFEASGIAHHPYSFYVAPGVSLPEPQYAPLADLDRLEKVLDGAYSAYGVSRRLPIYLTEYGYETSPPRPIPPHVTLAQQALYLDQAEYLAWRDPRVRSMAQFELQDSAPDTAYPPSSSRYWSTFQTGLEFYGGKPKPALYSYGLPIYLPRASAPRGGRLLVWGMLRAAPNGITQRAEVQWRAAHGAYRTIASLTTRNPTGFLQVQVTLPGSGAVRLAWRAPSGAVLYSRSAGVTATG
jgi:hypothetical protein